MTSEMETQTRTYIAQLALRTELQILTSKGWEIISQTDTTAQVRQRAGGVGCGILGFVVLPLLLGFVVHSVFYLVAIGGLLLVAIGMMIRKDKMLYLDGHVLAQQGQQKSPP